MRQQLQQLEFLSQSAPEIPQEVLARSSWLATRVRHVDLAIRNSERPNTVNGWEHRNRAAAAKARRTIANRLVALEQRYRAHPYRIVRGERVALSLDPLAGVLTVGGRTTTVRIIRCAACGELLPLRSRVIVTRTGVVADDPIHSCTAPEVRAWALFDPIREALSVPVYDDLAPQGRGGTAR